ncbi:MAG TPA: AAA family ATPase [Streptosporangiaceae bacterium]|nr:AAA family ATPase [Streptosporangiaceae bacterium]
MLRISGDRLVGRDGELRRLLDLLDDAADGHPTHTLISGDAGVGKTRLVSELAARAADRHFTVLSGRCAELGESIPYLPLADGLRDATSGPDPDQAVLEAIAARPVLGRLLPDRGPAPPPADLPGLAQQQLFGAVLGMLAELAAQRPVLLVLEDLHWADRSTRDLLTFLSRVLHRDRVAVVVTYRTDDLYRRHPLRPVVAELLRLPGVTAIELAPLGYADMTDHLSALAAAPLSAATLHRIVTRAEGNPYYGEELLAVGNGKAGSMLPTGLAALLLARFEQVSAPAQHVLRAAAVAGRRVEDDMIRDAAGLAVAEFEAAIRESVAHQLLVPEGSQGYAFRHALIREAIYGDLLPTERTRLHARFAELLADPARLGTVPGTAAVLAYHCLASHDIAGAFTASVQAAQEAERLAAPAEASRHYEEALGLWERVSEPDKLAGMDRSTLGFHSATSTATSGDVARAVQKLRRLREYLGRTGDPELTSRVCERLAYFLLETEAIGDAVEAARAAVDALPADSVSWKRARALATYAQTLMYGRDGRAAARVAQRAQAAARAADAPWVEADALVTLAQLNEASGRVEEAIGLYTAAHQQARDAQVLGVELRAAFQLARSRLERGDLAGAVETAHEGVARAEEKGLGLAPYGLDLEYLHYLAHYADGSWDHAAGLADSFGVRATTVAEARLSAMALFVEVGQGNPVVGERRAWLEPFWSLDRFGEYIARGLLAEHALWRGDPDGALAEVAAALATQVDEDGYGPPVIRVAAIGLAAHATRAGRARAAGDDKAVRAEVQAAKALIGVAREGGAYPRQPKFVLGIDGRGWLARAEAEWGRVRGKNNPVAWQAVVDAFGPGFVYESARARWRLAEALAEKGQRERAEHEWKLAMDTAERLGAVPLLTALADVARRARLGPRPASYPPGVLAGLTAREREVLELLSEGMSNREIAGKLFIAPKTASVHVSNILAKLGASSRTEAAAIAHRQGPAEAPVPAPPPPLRG